MFFSSIFWKQINFSKSAFILLEMAIIGIILKLVKKCFWINIIQCLILVITVVFSYNIFYLTSIIVIKKSKIYCRIRKN